MSQRPTEQEKETFLSYIRNGADRATAAHSTKPGFTGRTFGRLCREGNPYYDADFATAYERAISERGPEPGRSHYKHEAREPAHEGPNGTKAPYLTDDQLKQYLDMVREGTPIAEAAGRVEPKTTQSAFRRRENRDPAFAAALSEAKAEGYPAFREAIKAEAVRQAMGGDYRALRDLLLIHVPEYEPLRTTRHAIGGLDGGALRLALEQFLPNASEETLAMIEKALEEGDGPQELTA